MYIIKEAKIPNVWYHGSKQKITSWSTEFTGKGNDQEGAGIYFTSDLDDAEQYGSFIHKVELKFTKQMSIMSKPSRSDILSLIKKAPNYKETLTNFAEKESEAIKEAVNIYIDLETNLESVKTIESDFYRGEGKAFCGAMTSIGYDGFIIQNQYSKTYHAIVWNPKIINIL